MVSENGRTESIIASGNLLINGDNLEALKNDYYLNTREKVDCISVDPPYNIREMKIGCITIM